MLFRSTTETTTVALISQTIQFTTTPATYGYNAGDPNVQVSASASSGLPITWSTLNTSICTVSQTGSVRLIAQGSCEVHIAQDGKNALGVATKYSAAPSVADVLLVIDPATPSAPTLVSVTNGPSGLTLVWSAPSRTGSTSLNYTVTGVNGGSSINCTPSGLTCLVTTAAKGTTYSFTVTASNTAGSSPASNSKNGTWMVVPSIPTTTASVAKDPTDGTAISVTWQIGRAHV